MNGRCNESALRLGGQSDKEFKPKFVLKIPLVDEKGDYKNIYRNTERKIAKDDVH